MNETEVAKTVKKLLSSKFPSVKFSVRTNKYSMGSSIDVYWTDGPTTKQVEELAGGYHGAEFDGMIDLKYYNHRPYDNDYIFFNRRYSNEAGWIFFRDIDLTKESPTDPITFIQAAAKDSNGYGGFESYGLNDQKTKGDIVFSRPDLANRYAKYFQQIGYKTEVLDKHLDIYIS